MPEKASLRLAFLFAAIHGAHPVGPLSLRSNVQNRSRRFFTFCYPAKCPLGQLKLLKIVPDDFYSPPSMALTLPGHRRFAPMFNIAPGDFVLFAG
jgi:hypothetical protein